MAVVPYKDTVSRLAKSPMQKTFTFLGVTLIVVIIFLMGAIKPTMVKISSIAAEIKTKTDVNEQLQAKITNLQQLQEQYESKKDDLTVIDYFFPI